MSIIKERLSLFYDNPVTDWHEHFWGADSSVEKLDVAYAESFVEATELLGIDRIVASLPVNMIKRCSPELFISANNVTYDAMKRYPGKVYGMAYVHPGHIKEALNELDRCIGELGFIGVKLYYDYTMDDPAYGPIIEKCIELDVPILQHSMHFTDAGNRKRQSLTSNGVHMAKAARRYPEATFIMGHFPIGEWQYSLNAIVDCPNVYTDISGSVYDCPQIEDAVKLLGANRILFGTDGTLSAGVGKLLGADISEADKKTILAGPDFERYFERVDR